MFLSNASIRRPVAMSCLIIALTLLGLNAYRKIGVELLPKVDMPYITITTIYPGASPKEIETDIARPVEDQMVTIEGLKHVTSSCMENACMTFLEFNLDVNVDIAAMDVREKLDLIRADLPQDAQDPQILKYDVNAKPIMQLALTGDVPLDALYDYADDTLRARFSVIQGVADIQLIGGAAREVHVLLDRDKLASRGLTSLQVVQTVQNGVRTIPSGRIQEGETEYSVKFDADYSRVEALGDLEVTSEEGRRLYVRDIGRPVMSTEELRQKATIDGRTAVAIKVVKKSDANAVEVVNRVREALDDMKKDLPGGMELVWVTDDGIFIEASVNSAWINVAEGILLTAMILFLFLYNLRALLVVVVTMPLTIVIGLFFLQILGFSLSTTTLLAMGMSVGILVTNSIVVLEAIVSRLERTGDPREASRLGAADAGVAVLASAGTNLVVLLPLAMMGGLVGMFIKSFALTMLIMTIVSLFISFTLTPILCALLLKPVVAESKSLLSGMERAWNRMFDRVVERYGASLVFLEKRRWASLLLLTGVFLIFVHSLSLAAKIGSSMANDPDRGEIFVKMEFPTRYNLDETVRRVHQVSERLSDLPHLRHVLSTIGKVEGMRGQSSEGVYLAQILLRFSERIDRETTIHEIADMVRSRLENFPDCILSVNLPHFSGGQASDVEMEIAGQDLETLDRLAIKAQDLSENLPGIRDVDTSVRPGKPELRIKPDRAVLADLGAPVSSMGMTLRANLEGITAGTFKQQGRNYDIVVKLDPEKGKEQIESFQFPGRPGKPILLGSLGTVEETRAPILITRKDKERVSKLFANLSPGTPLGTAVNDITGILKKEQVFPPGYKSTFAGMFETMAESQVEMREASLIAVILVILTLAAILESFKQPVIILVTLPLALVGMLWALYLSGYSLEFFVLMGGVMLIGIVVNNAILIMDLFNLNIRQDIPRHRAMISASCGRFRPIVMITLAAVLGMLPLAFGRGIGAEMRNASGMASAGGILVSGVLTMYVMPVLYNLFTRRDKREKNLTPKAAE
ncbi:MAG: efflux RND transporter permease subunit [Proteobacteria bacterium]|nr:efflux RND transporter permease subunit [Pseudomonadota bacterium]